MMEAAESKDIFLSCFKCGRIVKSSDAECPRCGLQFGPGTLFECPFCSGLIWRNATKCASCGIDLTEFSESVVRTSSGFDMDNFVEGIINNELEQLKSTIRRVACPGCGLMIRGDEEKCPRCDLPLEEARVDCPVCGEKISISAKSCNVCQAVFEELPEEGAGLVSEGAPEAEAAEETEIVLEPIAIPAKEEAQRPAPKPAPKKPIPATEGLRARAHKPAPAKKPVPSVKKVVPKKKPKPAKKPVAKKAPAKKPSKPAKKAPAKKPAAKKKPAAPPRKAKKKKR